MQDAPTNFPVSALKLILWLWIQKKTWEKLSLLIPLVLAFALPIYQDKQLSQPTPIAYYIMTYALYPHGHTFAYRGIIHSAWTLRCGIFW